MSTQIEEILPKPKVRLKFIDMARSVAILLMLEGHFVDDSLVLSARDPENPIYAIWHFIRSFTAPIFLTVTGIIFVYLLLQKREESWIKNIRIKKGFKRVLELFFWGYMVQWYAFHVLECIAVGIFSILIIYGIYKIIKVIPLWIYFFLAGVTLFVLYPFVQELPLQMSWAENIWYSVLNIVNTECVPSIQFPTVPFVAYTMFGAMIGALLHDFHSHVKKLYFPLIFTIVGAAFFFFSTNILDFIQLVFTSLFDSYNYNLVELNWQFQRIGMVIMELSVLMYIDNLWGHKINGNNLFLKIGQNTLTVYILHMVLLYGSISGIGLGKTFHEALSPWQVAFGAAGFVLFFVIIIKYLESIKAAVSKALEWINIGFTFLIERLRSPLNK
ncbi:MAG: putative membrane protein [Salibacteraceae bacterium]|jgi:uncharacterized membrane protein